MTRRAPDSIRPDGRKRWVPPAIRSGPMLEAKCGRCDPRPNPQDIKHCRGNPPS